ncbi:ferredoxin [Streptomyces sp. NPDC056653]|uniref:ferredoxin n=1 Tax=Streptomyces sp. NPDC056653 TaxID=3345894 RepID=UPI0036B0EC5C
MHTTQNIQGDAIDAVQVSLSRDQCVGSGYCRRIAPQVFDLDASGIAYVVQRRPAGAQANAAREAESSCPSLSITVQES